MQIAAVYSHLNGEEYLLAHRRQLWEEVREIITSIDAWQLKTKISREKRTRGETLFSPVALNRAFQEGFRNAGWREHRTPFWVTADEEILREAQTLPADEQKQRIEQAGLEPIMSYNQTDFVKDRVALEVQFGKYAFVAHDLFVNT